MAAGVVVVRFGKSFAVPEATRVADTLLAFRPVSQVTLDFTDVEDFEEVGVAPLAACLEKMVNVRVVFQGLTIHQARMLVYFGVHQAAGYAALPKSPTKPEDSD